MGVTGFITGSVMATDLFRPVQWVDPVARERHSKGKSCEQRDAAQPDRFRPPESLFEPLTLASFRHEPRVETQTEHT